MKILSKHETRVEKVKLRLYAHQSLKSVAEIIVALAEMSPINLNEQMALLIEEAGNYVYPN